MLGWFVQLWQKIVNKRMECEVRLRICIGNYNSQHEQIHIYIIKTQLLCLFVCPDCIKRMEE